MTITLHNTLSGKKEEFVPLKKGHISIYVCGITPYDKCHLGHARAYVVFDTIRRHLMQSGYTLKYVQNFTDIDDKIIKRSIDTNLSAIEVANANIADYFKQIDKLNVLRADEYPRVSEKIPQIIEFVSKLIEKGYAYEKNGDVYFSVRKFDGYGKLSKRSLDDIKSGARVSIDEEKNDPLDFALWKRKKENEPADCAWQSPWGKGRPGWHIECSVMSAQSLGDQIDIHGGGQDLIFPHHENEIAQSEAATGKQFVKYWMHNGFVTINKEKMSKSLGNFFTMEDIFAKFEARAVRYFLLSQHYRSPIDFSDDKITQAQTALKGIDELCEKITQTTTLAQATPIKEYVDDFNSAMNDDFSTEKAIAVIHRLKNEALLPQMQSNKKWLSNAYATLKLLLQDRLGISLNSSSSIPQEVLKLSKARQEARNEKRWQDSDNLRKQIEGLGYKVEDKSGGTAVLYKKTNG